LDENFASNTLAILADLPADRPVALLMRHSVRVPILRNEDVYIADLTPEGLAIARKFGKELAQIRPIGRILTSPVSRCVNTSIAIAEGAGWKQFVQIEDHLSHPFMAPVWNGRPVYVTGSSIPPEISTLLKVMVVDRCGQSQVDLFVTHDTVVEALAGFALGNVTRGNGSVPNYLEALFAWQEGSHVCLSWRGREQKINLPSKNQPAG
jgi:hypothetical protein